MNRCGQREALAVEGVGQKLVVRALKRLRGDCDRREERKHRRRVTKGLEDGDVQEHARERDSCRVRSATPDERPHESSNRRGIAPSLAMRC